MASYLDYTGLTQLWDKIKALVSGKADDDKVVHKTSAETVSGVKTFSSGFKLNTATSWTSSDRSIPFGAHGDASTIQYQYTDSSKGLTYNPNTGALKAASFVKRNGTSSQFLKADGSVDSNTYVTASAVNGKANDADVVHKTGSLTETVTGTKTFDNMNSVKATLSRTVAISSDKDSIAASPFTDTWHDMFAFMTKSGYFTLYDHETTTDGSTWTTDSTANFLSPLFIAKEDTMITILSDGMKARRFTLYNGSGFFANAMIMWYEFGIGWSSGFPPFKITVETSSNRSSWAEVCSGNAQAVPQTYYIRGNEETSFMKDYIRITFTKISGTSGTAVMSCIRALTKRKGQQGRGKEYEFPYNWDIDANLLPKVNSTSNLGTSNNKWGTVYASTFNGNATSATKDGSGNIITTTYATKATAVTDVTYEAGDNIRYLKKTINGTKSNIVQVEVTPNSNSTGLVTSGGIYTALAGKADKASPTFTGTVTAPTFSGALSGNATTATTATNISGLAGTADAARHVWFSDAGYETRRCYDEDFMYNPSTNVLTVGSITGNAATATTATTATTSTSRGGVLTCSTAASTAAKVVACAGFTLARGAMLTIKFTYKNSAASPTLNVNSTGAKPLYVAGSRSSSSPAANTEYLAVYDIDTSGNGLWNLETSRVAFERDIPVDSSQITFSDDGGVCEENVITEGNTVDGCLADIDTALGEMLPVDVSSLFNSTPTLPSGYTFTQLRSRSLYRKVGYVRYPVTLKNTIAYYIDYNGTTMTPVSASFSTGDYITVSGTLKDTNGNGISGRTITLRPVDTDVASGNLSATTGSGGAFSFSNVHTATDYTITLSSGTPNPRRMSAYLTTGNKTFNITV